MGLFYAHLTNGDDLPIRASIDPNCISKGEVFRELDRALLKQYGAVAGDLKVKGFASCNRT